METFFASVEKRAYRTALIAVGEREEALDIVQDSMYKMVKRYADRPHAEWGPLFHTILQSRIRDWYRRRKVRKVFYGWLETDAEAPPSKVLSHLDEPVGELRAEQTMQLLEAGLHDLPLRQQQAFLLRVWEGYNVAETARIMKCSASSVKTHLARAMHTLRELVGDTVL